MNGARTLKIHQEGAALGLHRPTSTTGVQPLIARCDDFRMTINPTVIP